MNKWLKIILIILSFALISGLAYLILYSFGITNINTLRSLIINSGPLAAILYVVVTTLLLTFLCFVPLLNSSLIVLAIVLFETKLAFILILFSTLLANTFLFLIGKFGKKLSKKFIKKDEFDDILNKITTKSKILLPILFVLPGVPDESLCLVAGMTNMKYLYLISVSAIYHTIEIGLFCFVGSGIIDWSTLSILDWFLLINILIFDILWLFKLEKKFNNKSK